MFSIAPCQRILLLFIHIPNLLINSALLMQTGRTLQGARIDVVGPYFLQIGDCRIYELLCHYLTVISKSLSGIFPQISFYGLPLPYLHKITYIKRVLRQKRSQIWLFRCRIFPQATADCNGVVKIGLSPTDDMDFNTMYGMRLFQMISEIRIRRIIVLPIFM